MAEAVLLVPGTSGTKLLLNGQDVGWPGLLAGEAWLSGIGAFDALTKAFGFGADEIVAALSMEFADAASPVPTKTTLRADSVMAPGPVLHAAYNQFEDAVSFVYDWRSDVRDSGAKLLAFLEANRPAGGRWKLLAHSQGGLVVVVAARLLGTRAGAQDVAAFSRLVSHVDFCAVPFYGTVNAADALANGDELAPDFHGSFARIARTWPSLYQMLASWPGSAAAGATLLDDAAWTGSGLDPALLARARATRDVFFRHPLAFLGNVKVRITMSKAHATHNAMARTGNAFAPAGSEPGDTLVAFESTRAAMNDIERQATVAFGGSGDTAVHAMILNDPAIAADCRSFLAS